MIEITKENTSRIREVVDGTNQSINCRECGSDVFIASVCRGTNGMNSVMQQIGCPKCKGRMVVAPTVHEAIIQWIAAQLKSDKPETFVSPCGGVIPKFP